MIAVVNLQPQNVSQARQHGRFSRWLSVGITSDEQAAAFNFFATLDIHQQCSGSYHKELMHQELPRIDD